MSYQPNLIKKLFHGFRRTLAKNWLSFWHPLQIGITGSQGKTSTTQILAQILNHFGQTVVTDINLDTNFNVPITALKVTPWTKYVVWELGIDHIGEMSQHLKIAKPSIGIITGISSVHSDKEHLGSLENIIKEKRVLIEKLPRDKNGGVAILNYDDKNVRLMKNFTSAKVIFYGSNKENCQYYFEPKSIKVTLTGTSFNLIDKNANQSIPVRTKLIGSHFAYNFTAVYTALSTITKNEKRKNSIFQAVAEKIEPLKGRMNIEKGPYKTLILNDSLRANPKSTEEGIKTFYQIGYENGRKIAVLGVMGELADPISDHKKTGDVLSSFPPDIVIGVGDYRKYTLEQAINNGFPKKNTFYAQDFFQAAKILKKIIKPGDFIYLKGSLLRNLYRIIKILNNQPICCTKELCPYEHCR